MENDKNSNRREETPEHKRKPEQESYGNKSQKIREIHERNEERKRRQNEERLRKKEKKGGRKD